MLFTANGCGTRYYGKRDVLSDGSYITTLFVVFLWFPVLPLRSYRVLPGRSKMAHILIHNKEYLATKVQLNILQILNVYLTAFSIVIGAGILMQLLENIEKIHK